jgi:hypothetical protein
VGPTMPPPSSRKRRATVSPTGPSPPVKASFKQSSTPLTAAAIATAEKNKRRDDAQQVAIPFDKSDRYRVGLKLLLSESIYNHPNDVSQLV